MVFYLKPSTTLPCEIIQQISGAEIRLIFESQFKILQNK